MVKSGDDPPCLKSKAAEALRLGPALLLVCQELDDGTDVSQHTIRALQHLTEFYAVLQRGQMFLSAADSRSVLQHVETFLLHYNWLMHNAIADGEAVFPLQFKHHNLWHIAHYAQWLNPRFIWSYEFEDHMGALVRTAKNCLAGSSMSIVGRKVLENYTLVLELTLRFQIRSSVAV